MTVLQFAPDLSLVEYKLRGSFAIDADAPRDAVERAFYRCGQEFIRQLGKQGWESRSGLYLDSRPHPHYPLRQLPTKGVQDRYAPSTFAGEAEEGRVDYKFWGVFVHKEIQVGRANGSRSN